MTTVYYGVDQGGHDEDVAVSTSTTGKNVELVVDQSVVGSRQDLFEALQAVRNNLVPRRDAAPWARSLPSLRSFITANYNQPNPHNQAVMASPPTVTAAGTTLPTGMAVSISIAPASQATSALRILGGTMFSAGGLARIYSAIVGATGGNGGNGDGKQCAGWRADIIANAATISFRVGPTSAKYRFIVDGKYVDTAGTQTIATTGSTTEYITLDFTAAGGKAVRRITIEGQQTDALSQVWCESGGTLTRPTDSPKRIAFAGDSITYGTAATALADNYAWVCGDTLGTGVVLSSGAPGTGYVATGGSGYKLSQHLADINGTGPWDVIVVAMGVNDIAQSSDPSTVASEVSVCLNSYRTNNPSAQIFIVGPWDRMAPSAPEAGYAGIKSAIQSAVSSMGSGFTFIDPQGVAYTNTDGTHPDTAGHNTLGLWLAGQIKTALGA